MDNTDIAIATYDKTADAYTQMYFDDASDHPYFDPFIALLPENPIVLDVGCGPGNTSAYLLQKGCDVRGIDISDEMLKIARQKVPLGRFSHMDMRHLGYPDSTFDGILAAYSLIHIPSDQIVTTLQGFHRVLRDHGVMEIITQQGEPDRIVDDHLKVGEKMFFNFFTKERISRYLIDAGFTIVSQEIWIGSNTYDLSDGVIYTIARKT